MPAPSKPSLTLTATSGTSFDAAIVGTVGLTTTAYYRAVGASVDDTAGSVSGSGTLSVSGLSEGGTYQVYAVTADAGGYSLPAYGVVSLAQDNHLTTAFHSHFNGNAPLVASLPGGLWTGEVPEGTALPYAWLDVTGVDTSPTFEDEFDRGTITVHVYGLGAAVVENVVSLWRSAFNYKTLAFPSPASAACVQLFQRRYRLVCEMVRHRDSSLVYHAVLTYHVLVQKPR